jgi:hypothetical protein
MVFYMMFFCNMVFYMLIFCNMAFYTVINLSLFCHVAFYTVINLSPSDKICHKVPTERPTMYTFILSCNGGNYPLYCIVQTTIYCIQLRTYIKVLPLIKSLTSTFK